jgi:hypothetical protein
MPALAMLQQRLQAYLLNGADAIEAHVVGTARVPVGTRLEIYRNAYHGRLKDALEANYPALAKLLGARDFAVLAAEYVAQHESRFTSIRWYGDGLADFLATAEKYAQAPLLAELARWEWAMGEAFDAADSVPVDTTVLAAFSPERWAQLRLGWHPSVRVLALLWNASEIWGALTREEERPAAQLRPAPLAWLIWREDLVLRYRSLEPSESRAMALSRFGSSFGQLCDALCTEIDEELAARQAAAWLRDWVASGLIVSATVRE